MAAAKPKKTPQNTSSDKQKKVLPAKKNNSIFIISSIVGVITGIVFAYQLKWVGDDIFVVLRYIENFLGGNGLVYNIGEHVEGYTDFLWVMILALFTHLKFEPVETALNLGMLFGALTLAVVAFISFKLNKDKGLKYFVPLSVFILCLNYDFAVWSTSGLEAILYTFLLTSAFASYFFVDMARNKRLFISGLFLCLAWLTRPDTAMFVLIANAFLFFRNVMLKMSFKQMLIEQLIFLSAIFVIYVPYFAWRYNYYGEIFPNTYYCKLGYDSFYSRGFYYLWLYAEVHFTAWLYFLAIPVILTVFFNKKDNTNNQSFKQKLLKIINNTRLSAFIIAFIGVGLYLVFFVAKVGGDFMYARFVLSCMPFIAYIIEYSLFALPSINYKKHYALITALMLIAVIAESNIRKDFFLVDEDGRRIAKERSGIADERYVYVNQYLLSVDRKIGEALQPYFKDLDATVLVRGGQCCFVYYAKFQTCIGNEGLTDSYIAHLPVKARGSKIGHEHAIPYDYMMKRHINFVFRRSLYKKDQYRLCQFNIDGIGDRAEIICYDRKLMKELKQRIGDGFQYTNFEQYLDYYIANVMPSKSKEDLKKDYQDFKDYYFLHNDDKNREENFLNRI